VEEKSNLKGYVERLYDPFTIRLNGKVGAVLGAGLGYLSGLVGGAVKNILLNELSYLTSLQNIKDVLFRSFAYGNQVGSELALVGVGIGAVVAQFYTKKREKFVYVEEGG